MTVLEFVDALLGHLLSWPVLAFVVVLVLREPLVERIRAVRKARVGDSEVEFSERLQDAERRVDEMVRVAPGRTDMLEDRLRELSRNTAQVEENPSSSILIAWRTIETDQRRIAELAGITGSHHARTLARELKKKDIVSDDYVSAVDDLSQLRNAVAHGSHVPTAGEAANYVQLADDLRRFAEAARLNPEGYLDDTD